MSLPALPVVRSEDPRRERLPQTFNIFGASDAAEMKVPSTPVATWEELRRAPTSGEVGAETAPGTAAGFAGSPGYPTTSREETPTSGWSFAERLGPMTPPRTRPELSVGLQPQSAPEDQLPRFGFAGMSTPEDWATYGHTERKLNEFPKLHIPQGEAWERNRS